MLNHQQERDILERIRDIPIVRTLCLKVSEVGPGPCRCGSRKRHSSLLATRRSVGTHDLTWGTGADHENLMLQEGRNSRSSDARRHVER